MASDNRGSIQIGVELEGSLKAAIANMGEELRSVLRITNELSRNSMNTKSGLDALNKSLAGGTDSSSVYARATSNLGKHQQILATYFKNAAIAAKRLQTELDGTNKAGRANVVITTEQEAANKSLIATLNKQVAVQKSISQVALSQDYKAQAAALTNLSNKYSMAGTRISMALTLPLAAFGRSSFNSFKTLEVQTVRTNKLINDTYVSMKDVANLSSDLNAKLSADGKTYTTVVDGQVRSNETLETSMKNLGSQLDQITMKYGISRELIQGLAGDYAEIGINEVEALARLVDLTALTEKLGNVDISESQNFIKSIFQTVQRVNRELDPSKPLDYGDAIDEITGQLAMFNLIENKTSLSLNNIAKGFPELTAAASSFGLSMGEATALMVPMVATGFQVGASANSVKVSLQRLVAMTKQNQSIIDELKASNKDFAVDAGVGIGTIQRLTDSYNTLKATKGEQGALEFFARIFGVRQGPRMEVAIQNLAQFQEALNLQGTVENELGKTFQKMIQKNTIGLGEQYSNFQIKKFEDLSKVVRLGQNKDKDIAKAFSTSRTEFARYLKDQAAAGNDILAGVKTEAGRAMIIAAAGGGEDSQAQAKFLQEVEASLNTAETRYNRSRELMKMIGRQVVPILGEVLKVIVPILSFVTRILEKIGPIGKMVLGVGLVFLAAIGPAMKILGAVFQIRSALATMRSISPFGRFRTQAIQINEDMVRSNELLFRMKGNLTQIGSKFYLQATVKELKELQKATKLLDGNARQQARGEGILRRLGVDKRASDFSGLMGPTQRSVKEGFEGTDMAVLENYRKEMFDDLGGTFSRILTEARAVGTGIAEEFISTLRAAGFDTGKLQPFYPTPTGKAPPKTKKRKGGSDGEPDGGSGGGPDGGGGTSPGGSSGAVDTTDMKRVKRGQKPTPEPDIAPPVVSPFNPSEWGIEQVYSALEKTMEFLHKATKKQLVEFAKSMNISKVSGLGLSSGALQAGTLRKHLMDAIMASQQIVAKVEENITTAAETVKDVIQPGAPPATGKTDGVEKASDEATIVATEAQADKTEKAITEQGDDAVKTIKESGSRAGRRGGTTGGATKKVQGEVAQTQQDNLEEVITNVGKNTVKNIEATPEVTASPLDPKASMKAARDGIQAIYKKVLPALAKINEGFDPEGFLINLDDVDAKTLSPEEVTGQWNTFVNKILATLDKSKLELSTAQKEAWALIEKAAVEGYAKIIQDTKGIVSFQKEKGVEFFDPQKLQGLIPEFKNLGKAQLKKAAQSLRIILANVQKGGATPEVLAEFRTRLQGLGIDVSNDLGEFVNTLILAMGTKMEGASSEDKAGIGKFVTSLKQMQKALGALTTSVQSEIEIEGQTVAGLAQMTEDATRRSINMRNRTSGIAIGTRTASTFDSGDVDRSLTIDSGRYQDAEGSNAEMTRTVDRLINQHSGIDDTKNLQEIIEKNRKKNQALLDSLKEQIDNDKKELQKLEQALSVVAGKTGEQAVHQQSQLGDDIARLKAAMKLKEDTVKDVQNLLKADSTEAIFGTLQESILERANRLATSTAQLRGELAGVETQFREELAKLEALKDAKPLRIQELFVSGKEELATKIEAAQKYAKENAQLISQTLDEYNDARNELGLFEKLISSLQRRIVEQEELLSVAKEQHQKTSSYGDTAKSGAQLIELQTKLNELKTELQQIDPIGEEAKALRERVRALGEVVNKIVGPSIAPVAQSDQAMMKNAEATFEEEVDLQKTIIKQLTNRKIHFATELNVEQKRYMADIERLRAGLVGGFESNLGQVVRLATPEGDATDQAEKAALIAAGEVARKKAAEVERIGRSIVRGYKTVLEVAGDLGYRSIQDLQNIAVSVSIALTEQEKELGKTNRKIKKLTDDKASATNAGDIAALESQLEIFKGVKENIGASVKNFKGQLADLEMIASEQFGGTIFETTPEGVKTKKVIGAESGALLQLNETIANGIFTVQKNAEAEIDDKLKQFGDLTRLGLKEFGFKSTSVQLGELGGEKLRLTSEVFKKIAEEFGIEVPRLWQEFGKIADEQNIVFQDKNRAIKFVTELLKKVKTVQSKDALSYDPEVAIIPEIRKIDQSSIQLSKGVSELGLKSFGFTEGRLQKISEILKKLAGIVEKEVVIEEAASISRPRKDLTEEELSKIRGEFLRINSTDEEIGGYLTIFEEERRNFYALIAERLNLSTQNASRKELIEGMQLRLKTIKMLGGTETSPDYVQVADEMERVSLAMKETQEQIRKYEVEINRTLKDQITRVRERIFNTQKRSRLKVPAVKGAFSQGGQTGVLDIRSISADELESRKAPNPYLAVRPQKISEDISKARSEIIGLVKALQSVAPDSSEASTIKARIEEIKIAIDKFNAVKKKAGLSLTESFLNNLQAITMRLGYIPKDDERFDIAQKITDIVAKAESEAIKDGLDVLQIEQARVDALAYSSKLIKEWQERELRRALDFEKIVQSQAENEQGQIPFTSVQDLRKGPRSLSAAARNPLQGSIIQELGAKLFAQLGLAGKDIENAINGYLDTLILSREKLQDVAMTPISEIESQMVILREALKSLGLTLEQALADPVSAYTAMADKARNKDFVKIARVNDFVEMFRTLALFAKDAANSTVESAVDKAQERLSKAGANAKAEPAKPQISKGSTTSLFGPGLDRQTQLKPLAKALAEEIKEVGFAKDLFERATKEELQLIAGYLLKGVKTENSAGRKVEVASREATRHLADSRRIIEQYFKNIVESADYVTLQTGFVAAPVVEQTRGPRVRKADETVKPEVEAGLEAAEDIIDNAVIEHVKETELDVKQAADSVDTGDVAVAGKKVVASIDDIIWMIISAVEAPLDDLLVIREILLDMSRGTRNKLSAAAKQPFKALFEHIENTIVDRLEASLRQTQEMVNDAVEGTRSPAAVIAETVTESLTLINKEVSDIDPKSGFGVIHTEVESLLKRIETLTHDELIALQRSVEKIMVDPAMSQAWVAVTLEKIKDVYEIITERIVELKIAAGNTMAPAIGGAGGGGRKPPVTPPAGGGSLPPLSPGGPVLDPINTSNLLKAYQYVGLLTNEFVKMQIGIGKLVMNIIPFGKTTMNLVFLLPRAAVGMYRLASSMTKVYKDAANGETGMKAFSKGINAVYKNLMDKGLSMAKSVGSKFIPGMSGRGGSGRGLGGMLSSQVGMSAGMLGTGPLGMMGGNILQEMIRSLSAIPVIGTPVVLILTAIAGVIGTLSRTSKSWKGTNDKTFKNFREGLASIKGMINELIKPFEDFIGVIIGGTDTATSGTDKAKGALSNFSEFFKSAMAKIGEFVKNVVAPAVRFLLTIVMYLYNSLKPVFSALGKFFEATFNRYSGASKKASEKIAEYNKKSAKATSTAYFNMGKDAVSVPETIETAWSRLVGSFGELGGDLLALWKNVLLVLQLQLMKFANIAIVYVAKQIVKLMIEAGFAAGEGFVKAFTSRIPGGKFGGIISKGLGISKDLLMASNPLTVGFVQRKYINKATGRGGEGSGVKEGLLDSVDFTFDTISKNLNKGMDGLIGAAQTSSRDSFMKMLKTLVPEGAGKGLTKTFANLVTQAFKNPAAADAAGQALRDSAAKVKELKIKATLEFNNSALDAVSGALGTAIGKIKADLAKQLNAQKDASLKVFDDQVAAIEALADAETALTATESYETNRRRMIRDNDLRKQNSRKDRALAIYEGRIDDARNIDLQELKDSEDFSEQLIDLDSGRKKELQAINRASAIETIKTQRDAVEKEFNLLIEGFDEYAEKLLANGTFTEAQWATQTAGLMARATSTSSTINTTFTDGFAALPGLITTNLSPVTAPAGYFATEIGKLAGYASKSFGQTTGVPDPASILGVTTGMLGGIGSSIATAFAVGGPIQGSYGTGLNAVNKYVTEKTTGTGPETTSSIFTQAITDAADKMVIEAENKAPKVAAAAAKLVTGINTELAKIKTDSIKEAVREAAAQGVVAVKKAIADVKAAGEAASETGRDDSKSNTWWFRKKGTGLSGWRAVPANAVDRYIGKPEYDFTGTQDGLRPTFFKGGMMPYGDGGPTTGPVQQGIPAILHGGEYVVRNSAVNKYGQGMLQSINQGTYEPKQYAKGGMIPKYKISNPVKSTKVKNEKNITPPANELKVTGLNMGVNPKFNTTRDDVRLKYKDFYDSLLPFRGGKDQSLYEWQVGMGGLNYNFMREIWRKESSDWKNNKNQKDPNDASKGSYAGGGLGISYENWKKWGGREFSEFPFNANPYQQMVVYNRMIALGYSGAYGVREQAKTAQAAINAYKGPLKNFHFGSEQLAVNDTYNNTKHPFGVGLIVSERDGVGYTKTGSSGVRKFMPTSSLRSKDGTPYIDPRRAIYKPFSYENGGEIPEYKIGGAVRGGAGKAPTPKPKKKGILDKIQSSVNSGMNFAADGLQGVGNLVYGAAESLAASTTNPLGKLLRIPGFKNARVAGPLEASLNAVGLAFDAASLGSTTPLTAPLRQAARDGFAKVGAKILPKTKTGVPEIVGKLAGKLGGKVSGLGEGYTSEFMNVINGTGKMRGTMGILQPGNGSLVNKLLRADNVAIREAKRKAAMSMTEIAGEQGLTLPQYLAKTGIPHPNATGLASGPLTSIYDNLTNILNPFKQRVGIHIGSRYPSVDPYSQILPGINQFGPGDQQTGMTYAWLQGTVEEIAQRSQDHMIGFGQGTVKGGSPLLELLDDDKISDYYITKSIGKIFRDQNIVTSESRRAASQQVLEVLPSNATKEQLIEALARHRKDQKFGGIFKNPFKKFNGGIIPKTPMRCGTCGKQFANGGFLRAHQHASHFNGGMMPEYKIGGLVKSGAGKKTVTKPKVSAIVKPSFRNPIDEIFKDIPRNIGTDASLENDFPTLRESGLLRSMDPDQSYKNISFKNPPEETKTQFMHSIFNNRYEVARKMIQLGLTTPPLLVDASKRISDKIYRFQIDSYARKEGQKMRVDTIGRDDRKGLFQDESLRNYYKTVLEYAYPKVYATAKFTKDYLEDTSIPKGDIPDSPSHAFITNRVSSSIPDNNYKQAGIIRQNVEYLSNNGKMKKFNIGFPQNKPTIPSRARNFLGITDDKSTYDDHKPWLISVLEQLQRFITFPYQIFDEALNISPSDLVRQKALQLNIYPYGKKYGQSTAGGSMTPWTDSKAVMMYHPWYGMNEFKSVAMHELLHALGAGHSMDEDPNGPYPHPTLLNHKYESIMNEYAYGLPSIRAGDAAFLQFLDKSMKRHLPVATEKMVRKRNIPKKFNGGMMPYGDGGPTHGPVQQGIPAILHGGEYVVRNSAVNKYGQGMLQSINQGTYKPKPYANGGEIPEYKIGGLVSGGAGKKPVDKPKKKGILDKIQGGVNSVMNTAADFIDYSGKQIKGMTYDPVDRLAKATLNPILKLLKVPGSKNLPIATPKQAALSGFETGLAAFGGPATEALVSKIAGIGLKGGLGPIERLGASIAGKFGKKAAIDTNKLVYPDAMDMALNPITKAFERAKPKLGLPAPSKPSTSLVKKPFAGLELFRKPIVPKAKTFFNTTYLDGAGYKYGQTKSADVYDIGGSEVAFGVDREFKAKYPFVKTFNRNPYEIANISPTNPRAIKLANDYVYAMYANIQAKGAATQVDALLYAMTRGDVKAGILFNSLAAKGRVAVPKSAVGPTSMEEIAKMEPAWFAEMVTKGLHKFSPEDLYFVHETSYKPATDKFGNLNIKPTSEFQTEFFDPPVNMRDAVKPLIDSRLDPIQYAALEKEYIANMIVNAKEAGDTIIGDYRYFKPSGMKHFRDTIHFSLNNAVTGHDQRETVEGGYIVISKLMDVLRANPGALSNLFAVDSWITPKPGQGLKIPKGSYDILQSGSQGAGNVQKYIFDKYFPKNQFGEIMYSNDVLSPIIPGGTDVGGSREWNNYIAMMANKMGVGVNKHIESPSKKAAAVQDYSIYDDLPESWYKLSPNEIARLFYKRNPFTGIYNKIKQLSGFTDFYKGGAIPYGDGGPTVGPMHMGIPATLHGGEYVIRKKAVDKYGMDMLSRINEGLYAPKVPSLKMPMANYSKIASAGPSQQMTTSESNHNYNFYVDNFIGETEWFNTMMKEYNVKVVPANQKQAGLESRVVKSYNGINRGM